MRANGSASKLETNQLDEFYLDYVGPVDLFISAPSSLIFPDLLPTSKT